MNKAITLALGALLMGAPKVLAQTDHSVMIQKNDIRLSSDLMTPEALWAMGRIGGTAASPDGRQVVYQVSYYSVKENKSHTMLFVQPTKAGKTIATPTRLTTDATSESDAAWIENGTRIAFLRDGQLWKMNPDGTGRVKLTSSKIDIEGFRFSPDGRHVLLIKSLEYHESIKKNPDDLPKASGRLVTDLNYRHWDHYVESVAHPFVATVNGDAIDEGVDILNGEPYESPMAPFGGIEQMDWSQDSKCVAYTCRKKTGVDYAISTDADIYLYNIETGTTRNLCKPEGYKEPKTDPTKSMRHQAVNHQQGDMNVGYDVNPKFSPDGQYVAWQSMAHDGYESDRNRLCVYNLKTGEKKYVTESFDSNVDDYCWAPNSTQLYFLGVWHAVEMVYQTDLSGKVMQLTDGWYDYGSLQPLGTDGKQLLVSRHSYLAPDDLYILTINKKEKKSTVAQITAENKAILDQLAKPTLQQRWVKTTDGKQELVWIVLPPHFDANKKYPALLFCEGGPQSPVSQFWSYRWNMFIMAANGYVVVAPNRRGLPGFGSEWNEAVSQDWTGQCMDDYKSAIDDAATLPYVDKDRLGAVGASFGGFSVYYLAGHHDKRFKCFIAHDGAFNLESMYTDTEEAWFSNWEYDDAYWNKDQTAAAKKTYENSPHRFVDRWDTPILCIHGEKDYRINANQGFGAFNAARMRGIPAELLIFPDENHWVLKPQNGILWQRTFFSWLDRWLKK
jgi:dipeptidyl aminopeptidase/acylaminoacyl peptidase